MIALTFAQHGATWAAYQPDGTYIGCVAPSRKADQRYAYEAKLKPSFSPGGYHCGYAPDADAAKRLLVSGAAFRLAPP